MKRELARLVLGQVCVHACMAGVRMAAPLYALRQGQTEAAVGILLAFFALTQIFLALPMGRYVDRQGLRKPALYCGLLASACAGLVAVWPNFAVMCLAAMGLGAAAGGVLISLQRHVGRMASDLHELRHAFSWLAIGPAFSNFVGPLMAGVLIDEVSFQVAFAALAALPLVGMWLIRRSRDLPVITPPEEKPNAWDLLANPLFRRVLLVNWFFSSSWDVHTLVVPILGHERGLSASAIGAILASFAVAATLIRLTLPWFTRRFLEWQVIVVAMSGATACLAIYPFMQTSLWMGVCAVGLGLCLGAVQPMIMSILHQITPPERHGEALGLRLMGINTSSFVMPMLFGGVGAVIGAAGLFWAQSLLLALGVPLGYKLRARKSRE